MRILKSHLQQRFGIENVPDGYVFSQTELGGLEVMSLFVGMLQIGGAVPEKLLDEFQGYEQDQYRKILT